MRKIFLFFSLFSFLFSLSSCGDTVTTPETGLIAHRGTGYEIQVPASWETVSPADISAPVTGKIELTLRSLVSNRGFMNNLVILSETLQTPVTSSEYAKISMQLASRQYLSVKQESEETVEFSDGGTSRLFLFHAKYNEVTEEHLFYQSARVCGSTVYLITIGLENTTLPDAYDRYKSIISSFICK